MTDTIRHHLPDDLLMAYAAGSLPEAFSLLVATHLSMCDRCRAAAESYDAVGGALLEDVPEAAMSEASLAATLAMLQAPDPKPARRAKTRDSAFTLPQPLADYAGSRLSDIRWRPVGMGVKQAILRTSRTATARMMHIPPGVAMPDHGHHGMEMTLVLDGAFSDAFGLYRAGDIAVADASVDHVPVATDDKACLCVIAADARLRFNSLIPRLLQPLLRI
nr:ChrR family anti-sigma-E factor [Chachezhania sediminis]